MASNTWLAKLRRFCYRLDCLIVYVSILAKWVCLGWLLLATSMLMASCSINDNETVARSRRFLNENTLTCGERYFMSVLNPSGGRWLEELRDIRYDVHSRDLTEADRLNGIEWEAEVYITYVSRKWLSPEGQPARWGNWVDERRGLCSVGKEKGRWWVVGASDFLDIQRPEYRECSKPDLQCSQVPPP